MNRDEIKQIIPHREPMLLIDEIHREDEKHAVGKYRVRGDEWFLQGHFPGNPVVPGVVLCEMMGQTCAILIGEQLKGKTPFFTGMNKVKFRRSARPGDVLTMVATIQRHNGPFYFTAGQVLVAGQMIAQGEFSFALIPNEEAAAT